MYGNYSRDLVCGKCRALRNCNVKIKEQSRRARSRQEDNIQINLRELECDSVNWSELVQESGRLF
jgi:hypothetical protein